MKKVSNILLTLILALSFMITGACAPKAANTINTNDPVDTSEKCETPLGNLSVHILDVGQGDSEFIVLPNNKTMLIDAGEKECGDTVVNYIKNQGYDTIDYIVATHPHADHIGGLPKVIDSFNIGAVYMPKAESTTKTYENLLNAINNKGLKVTTAKAGVSILNENGISLQIIAPNSDSYDDLNNYSAVVKLTYNDNSFLFMGDAEELSENEITTNVKANVLKVGHHGSNSSTGEAFLNEVSPEYAVISVGADNDYGHPKQTTIDKLTQIGATIYRTDKDGTITFTSNGTDITVDKTSTVPEIEPTIPKPTEPEIEPTEPNVIEASVKIASVDKEGELVVIKNDDTSDVDLTGWTLVSVTGNQRYTFPSFTLKAGSEVTIASGEATGDLKWTKKNIWNNSKNDPAELYNAEGNLVSSY